MSSPAPRREVAQRAFAREINAATHTFRESAAERAPVYVLLPTGVKANRVFVVGTLIETADVGSEDEYWQGRVIDPTGTVFIYAGQYQPEAAGILRDIEPPAYIAVVGKPRTYEIDDGTVNVSVRPEHLTIVDETTRDRWVAETAQRTLDRIERGNETASEYAQLAREEYGEPGEQYCHAVIDAVNTLAGPPGHSNEESATVPDAAPPADTSTSTEPEPESTDVTADRETADHGEGDDR